MLLAVTESSDALHPLRTAPAVRIDTTDQPAAPRDEDVSVVSEARLTIDVDRVESYTLLCTPTDRLDLAAGFLLTEGIIDGLDELESLHPCDEDPDVVRVRTRTHRPAVGNSARNLLIVSSCGACGIEELEAKIASLPEVGDTLRITPQLLRTTAQSLRDHQPLFTDCGGTHAAAVFDATGRVLASAEDAGRHNALDKAIGKCLRGGIPTAGCGVLLSGRVSLEMVGKSARAGLELIAAVSATTSLGVDVAQRCGITLCAFVRETRATVFTHPRRVTMEEAAD